jgi:1-aminocyclopropane-1-carboxylate deaminase
LLHYNHTPFLEITHPAAARAGIKLIVKREDLNHHSVSGNKWWKLKYNLQAASDTDHKTILTFGGAFSNHIFATAAATSELHLKSIGLIRGEKALPLNGILRFAGEQGMEIHYVSRGDYQLKSSTEFLEKLEFQFGNFYLIPEGGSNVLAVKGCAEFAETELLKIDFEYLCLPVGTGGTMAGMICGLKGKKKVIGVSVLKGGKFLQTDVENLTREFSGMTYPNWSLLTNHHHGGYAKSSSELQSFIDEMKVVYGLPLDPVYTGKLVYAVIKEIESGAFERGSTIVLLHTGGLSQNKIIL